MNTDHILLSYLLGLIFFLFLIFFIEFSKNYLWVSPIKSLKCTVIIFNPNKQTLSTDILRGNVNILRHPLYARINFSKMHQECTSHKSPLRKLKNGHSNHFLQCLISSGSLAGILRNTTPIHIYQLPFLTLLLLLLLGRHSRLTL